MQEEYGRLFTRRMQISLNSNYMLICDQHDKYMKKHKKRKKLGSGKVSRETRNLESMDANKGNE